MVRAFAANRSPARGYTVAPRGCGGIGRRARFRSVWASARGGSSPLIRIARLNGFELCLLDGDGECREEPPFRLGLRAGGGDPPQSGQREIFGIAVLAEPGALVCKRLLHVPVDVAEGLQ